VFVRATAGSAGARMKEEPDVVHRQGREAQRTEDGGTSAVLTSAHIGTVAPAAQGLRERQHQRGSARRRAPHQKRPPRLVPPMTAVGAAARARARMRNKRSSRMVTSAAAAAATPRREVRVGRRWKRLRSSWCDDVEPGGQRQIEESPKGAAIAGRRRERGEQRRHANNRKGDPARKVVQRPPPRIDDASSGRPGCGRGRVATARKCREDVAGDGLKVTPSTV